MHKVKYESALELMTLSWQYKKDSKRL